MRRPTYRCAPATSTTAITATTAPTRYNVNRVGLAVRMRRRTKTASAAPITTTEDDDYYSCYRQLLLQQVFLPVRLTDHGGAKNHAPGASCNLCTPAKARSARRALLQIARRYGNGCLQPHDYYHFDHYRQLTTTTVTTLLPLRLRRRLLLLLLLLLRLLLLVLLLLLTRSLLKLILKVILKQQQ